MTSTTELKESQIFFKTRYLLQKSDTNYILTSKNPRDHRNSLIRARFFQTTSKNNTRSPQDSKNKIRKPRDSLKLLQKQNPNNPRNSIKLLQKPNIRRARNSLKYLPKQDKRTPRLFKMT